MASASRYEIVNTIATGDFATVYRARDRELGREVAIKQIHQQFLSDEQRLARYWQEAQLLASLQHPNIVTIYDIVRSRGWLVLELMRGNLQDMTRGEPIDLDLLRRVLAGCLNGLQFLHVNGVIHGDVKPANILVDARNRVVLGDFGLARRASSEEGSLLKGTTKYMAPELVSNQFGAVGPASDLYSLGFSAYELMCGAQFESLFPGLSTFGRDRQIAWMMWHAAPDRKLPEIERVLEGVPEELARVVQKLIVKDQARRYQSAPEVLRDLKTDSLAIDQPPEEDPELLAAREAAAKRKQRLRFVAILTMAFSLMLCIAILLPSGGERGPAGPREPIRGVITHVDTGRRTLEFRTGEDDHVKEVSLTGAEVFVNDVEQSARHLEPGDEVKIVLDEAGQRVTHIYATRPDLDAGRVKMVEADEGQFVLTIEEGDQKGKDLLVSVPGDLKIAFNGSEEIDGHPVRLADLQMDDHVDVAHVATEMGRKATKLSARRVVDTEGILRDLDASARRLTVAVDGDESQTRVFPVGPECEVTINDRRFLDERILKPSDLRPGDQVTLGHDTHVVRVNAYRVLGEAGVIRRVQYAADAIEVILDDGGKTITYLVPPECEITLGGEPVTLDELRDGDKVDVTHDSPGARTPAAITVAARRPPDPARWAILIGIQDYEDRSLSKLSYPVADARLLRDVLIKRYGVPANQALLLTNESLVRLEQGIPDRLGRIGPEAKVILYFAGHAYRGDDGAVYLAPTNFDLKRIDSSGLPLQWLVDQFEGCVAGEKLLLLDCSHAEDGADLARQPSTAEMIRTLKVPPGRAPLRTITALASCREGQRGLGFDEKGHGLFAWSLAESYSGGADKNRDNRLEPTELFAYLNETIAATAGKLNGSQAPELFLPDDRPPRLSEDARKAIRKLASHLRRDRIDVEAVVEETNTAERLAGKELEPKLLYGLLMLKAREREQAISQFEAVKAERPELLIPIQGLAWARFEKRTYAAAVNELLELVSKVPKPETATAGYPKHHQQLFYWIGQLREFVVSAVPESWRPPVESLTKLDDAVAAHGPEAETWYQQGQAQTRAVVNDFDQKIGQALSDADIAKLKIERRRIVHYAALPLEEITQEILAGLDQ